jgi:hypothetical protein
MGILTIILNDGRKIMYRKLKQLVSITLIVCFAILLFSNANVEAAAVKINKKSATLYVGETTQLKINGTNKKVTWTSSDKSVATISSKGKVIAKEIGTTTITGKISTKKYSCKITVKYNIDSMLSDSYNWLVEDMWNVGFCDVDSYIKTGTDSLGNDMNISLTIDKIDKAIKQKIKYDKFYDSLADSKYKEVKTLWKNIGLELDNLYERVKEETPTPNNESYDLNIDKLNTYIYDLMNLVYNY